MNKTKKWFVRLFSILLCGILITGAFAPHVAHAETKTNPIYSAEHARLVMEAQGVVSAKNITKAGLKKQVKRKEFAKMLVNISAYKEKVGKTSTTSAYPDVKKSSKYAAYIQIAADEGWMKGDLSGKFCPNQIVTYEQAVSAIVALLGYQDSDFKGNLAEAKRQLIEIEKINTNVKLATTGKLTYDNVIQLLYNTLVAQNKQGLSYAASIDMTVDVNGDVDYLTLLHEEVEGPIIAGENWKEQIPFSTKKAKIYIDESKSKASYIKQYDVLYYSEELKSIYVYQDRATGRLASVSPNRMNPTSVSVGGNSYVIANQDVAKQVSLLGEYNTGDYITLLLDREGRVAGIGSAKVMNSFIGGIVLSAEEKVTNEDEDDELIVKELTILDSLGEIHTYEVEKKSTIIKNDKVEVIFEDGEPVVNEVKLDRLNGVVNSDASSFAGYRLTDSINILEYAEDGSYAQIDRERLAGVTINAPNILYYHINADKEITDLILKNTTGDNYSYGILLGAAETVNAATNLFTGTYNYQINGKNGMTTTNGYVYGLKGYSGPAQFGMNAMGQVTSIKTLGSFEVTSITETEMSGGRTAYEMADDVSVYLKKGGSYHETKLGSIKNLNSYRVRAYYNSGTGGRIRVIVAEVR